MLRAALARRGVAQAIVVVHSLAGVLGLAMALNAPEFMRGLVLLAPVSHPWPGGVAWYYTLAASRALGPLFRRLFVLPAGLATMRAGVREVFEPNPTPPDYIARTRLPLVLRPRHFKANAEDVVDLEAYVAALSPRYGAIRAPTAIVTGDSRRHRLRPHPFGRLRARHSRRDADDAAGVGHSPHHSAPESVVAAILEVDARARRREASGFDQRGLAARLRPRPTRERSDRAAVRADHGDAQIVGRAGRAERHAGDDDHALADADEAVDIGVAAGAVGHVAFVARVLGDDGVDAPDQRQPARRLDDRASARGSTSAAARARCAVPSSPRRSRRR